MSKVSYTLRSMDELKSEFVRQLEKHIDGLVEKSKSTFSVLQEKYDQAIASLSTGFPNILKYKKLVIEICCTV